MASFIAIKIRYFVLIRVSQYVNSDLTNKLMVVTMKFDVGLRNVGKVWGSVFTSECDSTYSR